jgi:hypothetical protein
MSKWNRWKLIHKETGLTFRQYQIMRGSTSEEYPVLLQSGIPAVFNPEPYYPSIRFLENREWRIEMKPAKG